MPHGVSSATWDVLEEGGPWLGTAVLAHRYSISVQINWRNLFSVVTIWKGLHNHLDQGFFRRVPETLRDLPVEFNESMNLDGKRSYLFFIVV